jgi:hypothetical protein
MENPVSEGLFEIKVEFEHGRGNPSRIFRTMAGLIESVQVFDQHLASTVNANIHTRLILQDIKNGSIRSMLKTLIEDIPDDALKQGEFKKVVGHMLFKGKHKLLDWCAKEKEIKERNKLMQLQNEFVQLSQEATLHLLPTCSPIEMDTLLSDIRSIQNALGNLEENDSAALITGDRESQFNKGLVISETVIRDLLVKESIESVGNRILKVKKPDYLGTSKWEFKYSNHVIYAKILDTDWLHKFQSQTVKVCPGDSLRVNVKEATFYGYNNEIILVDYEILEVIDIISDHKYRQGELF